MAKRENEFQAQVIKDLEHRFPGCIVLKNDANYRQGFPDLTILFGRHWAVLECKRSPKEPFQPNQEYYIDYLSAMSFSCVIFPENKEDVLDALQHAFRSRRSPRLPQRQ